MASRARLLFLTSLVALPALAVTGSCFAHNGRDVGPANGEDNAPGAEPRATTQGVLLDIYDGIAISVDPKTGVRSYTQVGDITPNPARAKSVAVSAAGSGPGVDYWVQKSFESKPAATYAPSPMYSTGSSMAVNDDYQGEDYGYYGYGYGYGGYLGYGYGGGWGGRPGHGHGGDGGGRPGHGGGGGEGDGGDCRYCNNHQLPSPPAGPAGGGVGSPPPYYDAGVGAPPPVLRYNTFRGRRG